MGRVGGGLMGLASGLVDAEMTKPIVARVASGEVHVAARTRALVEVATALHAAGIAPLDIALRRPTLDEVFLHLTGDGAIPMEVST